MRDRGSCFLFSSLITFHASLITHHVSLITFHSRFLPPLLFFLLLQLTLFTLLLFDLQYRGRSGGKGQFFAVRREHSFCVQKRRREFVLAKGIDRAVVYHRIERPQYANVDYLTLRCDHSSQ